MSTTMELMKTDLQIEREARNAAIYREWTAQTKRGASKTKLAQMMMKKYGIHSMGTIYVIVGKMRKQATAKAGKEAAL